MKTRCLDTISGVYKSRATFSRNFTQDSHVFRRTGTSPLICWKNRSHQYMMKRSNRAIIAPKQFDRQSALQTSQKDKNGRIPFALTFRPHKHAVKSIIFNNFKLLQNDPETGRIFSQPPLISFKRDKNVGNFLVRSALKTNEQPGTFKCARSRCKTCLFIVNTSKISGPKRSVKITDRFTCISANVIYCITCRLCNKLYIGEAGRRLGDRFREHLRDVEKNDKDASKPVARHFNPANHSKKHMAICCLSLNLGATKSRKNLEQKFIFQIGTLINPNGINERFSFN